MKIYKKGLLFLLIALLSISAFFGVSLSTVNAQLTPYKVEGTIATNSAVWHNIYDIKQNELVLISISGSDQLDSFLYYPNQTLCDSIGFSKAPVYQFNASLSGTYLLRLSGWGGYSVNYSISSSHSFDNSITIVTPTPTLTITPIPFPPINASIGDSVIFEVPNNYLSDNSTTGFMWDFGDGTNITTRDNTATHAYNESGNFTVTLKIQGITEEKTIQTYAITISPKETDLKIVIPLLAALITAGTTVLIFFLNKRAQKQKEKTNNPPAPPAPPLAVLFQVY